MSPVRDTPSAGGGRTYPYIGFVKSVAGTSPGPASGITYTIAVNTPEGVIEWAGVAPDNQRPPDVYDTIAAGVGTACLVYEFGGRQWIYITEYPDSAECEEPEE